MSLCAERSGRMNLHVRRDAARKGGFYKCALSDFEIVFEGKLKVVELSVAGYVTDTTYNLNRRSKQEQKKCLHLLCLARRRKPKATKKNPKDGKTLTLKYS